MFSLFIRKRNKRVTTGQQQNTHAKDRGPWSGYRRIYSKAEDGNKEIVRKYKTELLKLCKVGN